MERARTLLRSGLLACLLLVSASAAAQWQKDGQNVPDEPWRKSDGEFGAMLLLTSHLAEFVEAWNRGLIEGKSPTLRTTSSAGRGDTVSAVILFTHCQPGATGLCRSDVDFRVLRPDGSTYATHREVELWNREAPPFQSVQLGAARLQFEIEPTDPLGVYQIHADVYDRIAGRKVSLVQPLTVGGEAAAPASAPQPPATK